jgi:prepilin-type N-terminal cleavage/methylation domain-containing protein
MPKSYSKSPISTTCNDISRPRYRLLTSKSLPGFTLIELLVVIGIIAIIIGILLPSLTAARTRANNIKCMSNIRQLGIAMKNYALDNKDLYPMNVSTPLPYWWNDPDRLGRYIAIPTTPMNASSPYWCPMDAGSQQSYAMNVWASCAVDKVVSASTSGQLWPHRRIAGSMLLLADAWSYQTNTGTGYVPPQIIGKAGTSTAQRFGSLGGVGPISTQRWGQINCELTYARHRMKKINGSFTQPHGAVTIFFDDGHADLCADTQLVDPLTGNSSGLAAWSPLDFIRN